MKLTLAETKLIKDSVSIISDLVTEARFKVTKNAIELVAMDPANVAMVMYKLLSSAFVTYEVKEDVTISINLNDLKQVFRRIKAEDTMTLEVTDGKFKITLKSAQTRVFNLPLIDIEEKDQKVPDLSFGAKVSTDSSVLTDAIEDMDIIGESVAFAVDKKTFHVTSSSELSNADVEIKAAGETKIELKSVGEAKTDPGKHKAKYSIEYLKKMIQGGKLADKVSVQFSTNYPLQLDYIVVDKLQLSFILAPRVDND
jgi:proliferating cell nuclear antigen